MKAATAASSASTPATFSATKAWSCSPSLRITRMMAARIADVVARPRLQVDRGTLGHVGAAGIDHDELQALLRPALQPLAGVAGGQADGIGHERIGTEDQARRRDR